jgi:hypothetical protein
MDNPHPPDSPPQPAAGPPPRTGSAPSPRRSVRLPSARASAVLATVMLGVGIAVGAAIGPAPEASLAGSSAVAQKLPALIASVAAQDRSQSQTPAATRPTPPPTITAQPTPAASSAATTTAATTPSPATTPAASTPSESPAPAAKKTKPTATSNVPPVTSVWLIQLAGTSFSEASASAAAAPYITGELLPKGTYLPEWSALTASTFASDAALVEHATSVGATPPILHSIVQPPCPEGAAGSACAPGTPAGVSAADAFLKAAIATITATTTYSEHGLVVVTFATVAEATASELPPGASSATLASLPPAGAVLLSPFAKAGVKSSATFNPTSPKQGLEKLLH